MKQFLLEQSLDEGEIIAELIKFKNLPKNVEMIEKMVIPKIKYEI